MKTKKLHIVLVVIQFGGIFFFLLSGRVLPVNLLIAIIYFTAISIGLWAISSMNKSTITVFPDARINATLTKSGPYKLIRHPMYTSVFLFLVALLSNDFSIMRCIVLLVVGIVLISKMNIEEKILMKKFSEYAEYRKTTKKIFPFIY